MRLFSKSPVATPATKNFKSDERGSVAAIFGLTALMMTVGVGLAIDGGRVYHANTKIGAAIDAAALAAAKGMRTSNLSDGEVEDMAQRFFQQNLTNPVKGYVKINSIKVTVDRDAGSVAIEVESEYPTTFGRLAGVDKIPLPNSTVAKFDQKDIELSLSLDMTGSMRGSKSDALKAATKDLIDVLIPDDGTSNKVRIAFAPFSYGVNAGAAASVATDNRSTDGCVYERAGAGVTTDEAPGYGAFMRVAGDSGVTATTGLCPANEIVPLTDDKNVLKNAADNFTARGYTAGHLGTAWAWYMVSPNWSAAFGGSAAPAPYNDGRTIKAVVLMTDGEYNTYGGFPGSASASETDAKALCGNIKNEDVRVYTVGFQLTDAKAIEVMQECATSDDHYFLAENAEQLSAAFRAIAVELNTLRLTK